MLTKIIKYSRMPGTSLKRGACGVSMSFARVRNSVQFFALLIATGAASASAFAGVGSGGGGDAMVCQEKAPNAGWFSSRDIYRAYLADTFKILSGGTGRQATFLKEASHTQIYAMLIDQLNRQKSGEGDRIDAIYKTLKFEFVEGELEELDDDHIDPPANCVKKQLAIQDFEARDRVVRVNKSLHRLLSPLEQELLKIHEAYIRDFRAPANTTPIRALVKRVLQAHESLYSDLIVRESSELSADSFYNLALATAFIKTYAAPAKFGYALPTSDGKSVETAAGLANRIRNSRSDDQDHAFFVSRLGTRSRYARGAYSGDYLLKLRIFRYELEYFYAASGRCRNHFKPWAHVDNLMDTALEDLQEGLLLSDFAGFLGQSICDARR